MKSFFTLIILCIAYVNQSQILKKTYHDYQKTKPDEVYYVNSQGQKNGAYTKYDYEGAKAVEATYSNGQLNGPAKEYYRRNGVSKLKISGNYKNGEKNGQFITYTYVKYGQSYFNILQSMMYNEKEANIFNTGIQTKYGEEFFDNGSITKETKYHINGNLFYTAYFESRRFTGDYVCINEKNTTLTKGKIGLNGKMIGTWIIPREENGDCPKDKHGISNVTYTQMIKFDNQGNVDSNYFSKTYYLSGKLRDSVRVVSLKYQSAYDYSGIWYLCGPNTLLTGPYRSFYETGKIKTEGQFKIENGASVKTGVWKNYDSNGNLLNEINEDEIRMRAYEAKKEADRIENERLEKEKREKEEKLVLEKKIKTEFEVLTAKADSCVQMENKIFQDFESKIIKKYSSPPPFVKYTVENSGYRYIYVVNKKPNLYAHFYAIHQQFIDQVNSLNNKNNSQIEKLTTDELVKRNKINTEIIELANKHTVLNNKMNQLAEIKTKEIEKKLKNTTTIAEKIQLLENYVIPIK